MKLAKLMLLFLLIATMSCQKRTERKKPLLLASIRPYELLLTQLAGSDFDVQSIIPASASPHIWAPTPSDLKALMEASFILSNGLGLEANLQRSLVTRTEAHVEAATLISDAIPVYPEEHHEANLYMEDVHHHEGQDPHIWTSPHLMMRLVTALEKELSRRFPNSELVFSANAETIRKELEEAEEVISTERSMYNEPGIVTYHNSYHYFTNEFRIEYLGWVQFSPGKEPNPKDLAELGETIKDHKVKAIFIEPQMSKKAGEVLAKELDLKLLTIDPLGSNGDDKTISALILSNWEVMKEAFTAK